MLKFHRPLGWGNDSHILLFIMPKENTYKTKTKATIGDTCPECGELLEKYGAPPAPVYGDCSQHGWYQIRYPGYGKRNDKP